jgi:hypothetical protein
MPRIALLSSPETKRSIFEQSASLSGEGAERKANSSPDSQHPLTLLLTPTLTHCNADECESPNVSKEPRDLLRTDIRAKVAAKRYEMESLIQRRLKKAIKLHSR